MALGYLGITMSQKPKLIHGFTAAVGAYSLFSGLRGLMTGASLAGGGLGRSYGRVDFGPKGPLLEPVRRGSGAMLNKAQLTRVRSIDERVKYIIANIQSGSLSPRVKEALATVLAKKCRQGDQILWCVPEKNANAEIAAVFYAVRQPSSPFALRYTRDHTYVDQFMACDQLLRTHIGDCDDGTALLGAMLMSAGYPVRCRIIQDRNSPSWSHIYPLVNRNPQGSPDWQALDWSVIGSPADAGRWGRPGNPFWEVPGAKDCAKTGRPAGLVLAVKDYEVWPR